MRLGMLVDMILKKLHYITFDLSLFCKRNYSIRLISQRMLLDDLDLAVYFVKQVIVYNLILQSVLKYKILECPKLKLI